MIGFRYGKSMEISEYYLNTLKNAAQNLAPIVGFVLLGYFIFIKLPFLFFLKNMSKEKKKIVSEEPLKRELTQKELKNSRVMTRQRAELLFDLKPNEIISKDELKKRYHALLKMNHPDKVASLASDFKNLAHQKTKDINDAYELLMKSNP